MSVRTGLITALFVAAIAGLLCAGSLRAESNWPRFQGPQGTGQSSETGLPVEFGPKDVAWKTPIAGRGQSSPVIWGEKIFLTTASEDGKTRSVLCLDRGDGRILWQTEAPWTGTPEALHKMNCYASATCAVDGEQVVAFFGRGGLHCFDLEGKLLWSRDLGPFAGPWGTAASPVIIGKLVIQNCDAENDAFLLAVNKETGEDVWRTPRPKVRGWCTPVLIDAGDRMELVVNGELGVNAYDPNSGKDLWFCRGDTGRGEPLVAPYRDLLVSVNGKPGDMIAVKPGGSGTVNETHEVWRVARRAGRDLPSPIIVADRLFVSSMNGIGALYDPATGKEIATERIGGNYAASPIAAEGLIYIPSEEGEIVVLRPSENALEVVARNAVGGGDEEIFRSSLAPSEGQLFCRSDRVLYCIGKRRTAAE
jgi:outer membrane protein assembly factor BamB